MRRKDSRNAQFVQRIPADVRERLSGKTLDIPLDGEAVSVAIGPKTTAVRFSLRTADPSQAKRRQADVAAHLETVFEAVGKAAPVSLTHRQAVALSRRIYDAWATTEKSLTLSIEIIPASTRAAMGFAAEPFFGPVEVCPVLGLEGEGLKHMAAQISASREAQDVTKLEVHFGKLIDSQLLREGIGQIDSHSRRLPIVRVCPRHGRRSCQSKP